MENENLINPIDEHISDDAPQQEDSLEQLIAEAEQRGYIRGRNERIAETMNLPAVLENPLRQHLSDSTPPDSGLVAEFLSDIRPSVWD